VVVSFIIQSHPIHSYRHGRFTFGTVSLDTLWERLGSELTVAIKTLAYILVLKKLVNLGGLSLMKNSPFFRSVREF
jgi:hypothetical protein